MGFWVYMLIMDLLLPTSLILLGRSFYKKAPKDINSVFGYRTARSMKNRDTWDFAHRYCGRIWLICGTVLLPVAVAIMICFIGKDATTVGYVGATFMLFPLFIMIASVIFTEKALKKNFDKNGIRIQREEE